MATERAARHPPRRWSLRRRLLAVIVAASTALWLASLGTVAVIAWQETSDVFDDALEESGYMLMAASSDWDRRGLLSPDHFGPNDGHGRKVDMQYQIVLDGRVLQRSRGAPAQPFVADFDDDHGFADPRIDGHRWRVFVVRNEARRFEVQVGQQYNKRDDILEELAEHLWLPVLGFLVLLPLVCWLVIARVLQPLRRTATAIAAKTPQDLALVPTAGQPHELLPIVQALNGVLDRLGAALQAERRFTADAAHELRTPLAGLHMHVQLLQRQHPELGAPFRKLRDDIGRVTALVDSLLALARLDPLARENLVSESVALAPLVGQLLAVHAETAARRAIAISVQLDVDVVQAHPHMLEIALRNLVDNALRYCPDGSRIAISAQHVAVAGGVPSDDAGIDAGSATDAAAGALASGAAVRLAVRDDGPGVDAASRQRLTERFFRVLGHGEGQGGSGLGLSIVKRIADLHGATLAFGPGLGGRGLGVTLDLPPPQQQAVP